VSKTAKAAIRLVMIFRPIPVMFDLLTAGCGEFAAPARRAKPASGDGRSVSIPLVLFLANQDFAFSGVIGLADNAFLLHPLHD
jgi:hypothetical protein